MFRIALLTIAGALALPTAACAAAPASVSSSSPGEPSAAVTALREAVIPIGAGAAGYEPVVELAKDARVVLLGEASHGTEEFYRARGDISRRLVAEHGFDAVVLEADWPAAARVDRYVRGMGADRSAVEALSDFQRFPQWMWKNRAFADLVDDLRKHNEGRAPEEQVRVFGMDLYSPKESAAEVVRWLERRDPSAARAAERDYRCLATAEDFARPAADRSCAAVVARPLESVRARPDDGGRFSALQNARVAQNAEAYYRLATADSAESWNHRDRHMIGTLEAIERQLHDERGDARLIVWAHNSHLGDARATERAEQGELNVGQLARERWKDDVVSVGFTTYDGTVRAAPSWGAADRVYDVRPGRKDSVEGLFHGIGEGSFALRLDHPAVAKALPPLLQRAIGVIYRPETERQSHYFEARVPEQFDAVIHFDRTRAVEPLAPASQAASAAPRRVRSA